MADSAKSLTSLVLLVLTTALFAVGWSGDAHAQRRLRRRMGGPGGLAGPPRPPPRGSRPLAGSRSAARRELTRTVDTSPLARLLRGVTG